jgi:hypothetical protein
MVTLVGCMRPHRHSTWNRCTVQRLDRLMTWPGTLLCHPMSRLSFPVRSSLPPEICCIMLLGPECGTAKGIANWELPTREHFTCSFLVNKAGRDRRPSSFRIRNSSFISRVRGSTENANTGYTAVYERIQAPWELISLYPFRAFFDTRFWTLEAKEVVPVQ